MRDRPKRTPRASKVTAGELLRLAGAGTKEEAEATAAFCARGASALRDLLRALGGLPTGARLEVHPADFDAALTDLIVRLACRHPDVLVTEVTRAPALLEHSCVLAAAGRVRSDATDRWILEALSHSSQSHRWQALRILLAQNNPAVVPRLEKLLRDRSSSVRFAAADGLRRWGGVEAIPELLRYAGRAPAGGAERALDAIESIAKREGAPLPAAHPGARLVEIALEGAGTVQQVIETERAVREGELLAVADGKELRAPGAGVIVAFDRGPDERLERIVLRLDR